MDYLVPEGADASDLAARLEQTCQEATSGCVLVSGRRRALRRALQDEEDASTLTATLSRPLDPAGGGHLDDPIVASLALYKSNGVTATSERLKAVTVQLTVTSHNPNPDPNPDPNSNLNPNPNPNPHPHPNPNPNPSPKPTR